MSRTKSWRNLQRRMLLFTYRVTYAACSRKIQQKRFLRYSIPISSYYFFSFIPATHSIQVGDAAPSSIWLRGKELVFSDGVGFELRASEEDTATTPPTPSGHLATADV